VINNNFSSMKLEKTATFRTSTAPVDLTVVDDLIVIADLMKSVCIVQFTKGQNGANDKLEEVGRHYQTVWTTAVASIEKDMLLVSEAEGNLIVLSRNQGGVTEQDKHRLVPTSEIRLGEMVNRIRPINIQQLASLTVTPRAFLATVRTTIPIPILTTHTNPHFYFLQVEGSIYLFALINPDHNDFLITLQSVIASKVDSLGDLPFDKFRAFRTLTRSADAPYRFVDGELLEQFLDCEVALQEEIIAEVGSRDVAEVKGMIEALRRLH
jgi:DNA damage-binding protein 1